MFIQGNSALVLYDNWANLIKFGQNQNLASPKTSDLLRLFGLTTKYWKKSLNKSIFCVVKVTRYIYSYEEDRKPCLELHVWSLRWKTRKSVYTNVRFRSWSSKPF